jgi:hypothetical protein
MMLISLFLGKKYEEIIWSSNFILAVAIFQWHANTVTYGQNTVVSTTARPYDRYENKLEKNNLGFVIFDGNITVGKSVIKYSIGVMINVKNSLEAYHLAMTKLFNDIQRLGKIPVFKEK